MLAINSMTQLGHGIALWLLPIVSIKLMEVSGTQTVVFGALTSLNVLDDDESTSIYSIDDGTEELQIDVTIAHIVQSQTLYISSALSNRQYTI